MAREVDPLLRVVFQDWRKRGRLDLEVTERAVRSALHRAGAAALSQRLQFPAPNDEHRAVADSFERNAERMRYPQFRRQYLLGGSGVIEAGGKTVIASRFKRSGMFWTVRGANAIGARRCSYLNGRFEDYGESRRLA